MEIQLLTEKNVMPDSLQSFDRYQTVETVCVRKNECLTLEQNTYVEDWPAERKTEKAEEIRSGRYITWGAIEEGRIVGEIMLVPLLNQGRMIVKSLQVSRESRRKGIGRALFRTAVSEARKHHATGLYISASPAKETIDFYTALGCRLSTNPIPEYALDEPSDIQMEFVLPKDGMPDRTIPFYNVILRCDRYIPREIGLPSSFSIDAYREGDEDAWASLHTATGDFENAEEARRYFVSTYLQKSECRRRILFLRNPERQVIGSCIAWQDLRGENSVSSLHWLVVDEAWQGKGFGRALCLSVMNIFAVEGRMPVYIHTQPWSWKAILLYISLGFRIQKTDTFSHYENQYALAMETLRNVVDKASFEKMESSTQE